MRCKSRQSIMKRLDGLCSDLFHDVQQPQHSVAFHVLSAGQFPEFAVCALHLDGKATSRFIRNTSIEG
jgi:hypothetical protein